MSAKEMVTIVCRGLAVYFLGCLFTELTYLGSDLFSYAHHINGQSVFANSDYWQHYYLLRLSTCLLRIGAFFFAVQWFYRCGPKLREYFLVPTED